MVASKISKLRFDPAVATAGIGSINTSCRADVSSVLIPQIDHGFTSLWTISDFEKAKINLSKIESRPSKESDGFGYWFFIDFYGHIRDERLTKILEDRADEITWLGSYVRGDI